MASPLAAPLGPAVRCAWCAGADLAPPRAEPVSHGICPSCLRRCIGLVPSDRDDAAEDTAQPASRGA